MRTLQVLLASPKYPCTLIIFGGQPGKVLLNQLAKPETFQIYKIQDIVNTLCGTYCIYIFSLIDRLDLYNKTVKMYFEKINAFYSIW